MHIDNVIFQQDQFGNWRVPQNVVKHHILFLVIQGAADYRFGERSVRVKKGEALFFPQGCTRSAEADHSDKSGRLMLYSAHFRNVSPADMTFLLNEPFKLIRPLNYDYLKQRFSMLNECWIGKMPGYDLISRGILLEILGNVQRELAGSPHNNSRRNLALRIQQYIVTNYREPFHLNDLAKEMDRSPTYISTVFKQVMGRTPVGYMHEVRISAARELLLANNMTIGEIAESLGYCDQTYFNYMYKKIVGHPPSHTLKLQNPL